MNAKSQEAQEFLNRHLNSKSTVPVIAAEIWLECVAGKETQLLIVEKIFEEKQLPVERIPELKQRSLSGDDAATREVLGVVIETMNEGIEKARSTKHYN